MTLETIISDNEVGQVILAGQAVDYAVRRSSRAKNLRLQIAPNTGLTVIAPTEYRGDIESVIHSKMHWILNHSDYFNQVAPSRPASPSPAPEPQTSLDAGIATLLQSPLLYLGRECHILLNVEPKIENARSSLKKSTLRITVQNEGQAVAAIEQWYMRRARYYITKRAQEIAQVIGVEYNSLIVRTLKTRWGSCSGRKNLNFNWRLIMTPPSVIDYVIIHELCHLIELNHSKRFWAIVASRCPTYLIDRKWLRKNGSRLSINFSTT